MARYSGHAEPGEVYLGEGVYAGFDGHRFHLRTSRELHGFLVDDIVYLSPLLIKVFNAYVEQSRL